MNLGTGRFLKGGQTTKTSSFLGVLPCERGGDSRRLT